MSYLVHWDAMCWEAGSIVPDSEPKFFVVPAIGDARRLVRTMSETARQHVQHEVDIVLGNPTLFQFNTGYSYYAQAIQLPRKISSTEEALEWIGLQNDDGFGTDRLKIIASIGTNVNPPKGNQTPIDDGECLSLLLDWIGS